ncbi:PH-like domain-containing protein [Subtercola boreus]|uniref:PH domain-containing protein n=1 Tax=Subtercola boreus TaxID=120213 RepID=A0A3E0WBR7_9MICO|nr:hypothetical protein [Subtercola boreus]RFA21303.1 hypothetical protein B7R24_07950 [Subtercola boreus]RFA21686.1 hypothetical protein B7R23_07895 [Subtercola boreus]RFA27655.1 hypothetical protein B7R25_08020 [Subtercola boreus]
MNNLGPALIVLAVLVVVYLGMVLGWRARRKRQSGFAAAAVTPVDAGQLLLETPMLYVATTPADKPLERLALPGLAFRGRGTFIVWEKGVTLSIDGERDIFVPFDNIRSIGTSTFTIDRVVESGGLVRLDWTTPLVGDEKARTVAATAGATRTEKKAILAAAAAGDRPSSANIESYVRILDQTASARVLSTVQALLKPTGNPQQKGQVA